MVKTMTEKAFSTHPWKIQEHKLLLQKKTQSKSDQNTIRPRPNTAKDNKIQILIQIASSPTQPH